MGTPPTAGGFFTLESTLRTRLLGAGPSRDQNQKEKKTSVLKVGVFCSHVADFIYRSNIDKIFVRAEERILLQSQINVVPIVSEREALQKLHVAVHFVLVGLQCYDLCIQIVLLQV